MIDKRCEAEKTLYGIVLDLLQAMSNGKIRSTDYMVLMGRLRDLRVSLENKRGGCLTGRHASTCKC